MNKLNLFFLLSVVSLAFMACSKDDSVDTTSEFYNWQAKNDAYFEDIYDEAREQGTANGWYILKGYAKPDTSLITDYIVCHVLEQTKEPGHMETTVKDGKVTNNVTSTLVCPMYKDSVVITYSGFLMPFDVTSSYAEKYNTIDEPEELLVGYNFESHSYGARASIADLEKYSTMLDFSVAATEGFSTALQYMHPGDRWRVFIPYNLAYGKNGSSSSSTTIPGYSTLIFDLYLKEIKIKE